MTDSSCTRRGYDSTGRYHVPPLDKPLLWKPPDSSPDHVSQSGNFPDSGNIDLCPECRGHGTHHPDCEMSSSSIASEAGNLSQQQNNDDCPVDCAVREGNAPVNIPLEVQERLFEHELQDAVDKAEAMLRGFLGGDCDLADLALSRLRSGFEQYGSLMFTWDAETRRRNVLEELADAIVYLISGAVD